MGKTLCNNMQSFYFNSPHLEMGLCNTVGHLLKIFTIDRPAPFLPPKKQWQPLCRVSPLIFGVSRLAGSLLPRQRG